MFLELWKRRQAELQYDWDVADYELEEVGWQELKLKLKFQIQIQIDWNIFRICAGMIEYAVKYWWTHRHLIDVNFISYV